MLPAKPWRSEAVIRLIGSVFLCIYAGALLVTLIGHVRAGKINPVLLLLALIAFAFMAGTFNLLRRPWDFQNYLHMAKVVGCFYVGLFLGAWAQQMAGPPGPSVVQMVIAALSFQGAALLLIVRFRREHGVTWGDAFGLDERTAEAVLYGVLLACIFLPIGWGLQWFSGELMRFVPVWRTGPEEQQAVQTLRLASTWADRLALGLVTILLAPLAEETLFRGVLYPWIKQLGFPRLALWGTSLLFAAVHLNVASFVPLLLFAVGLALLYERTRNLLAPIAAHAMFNAMNFVALYLVQRAYG